MLSDSYKIFSLGLDAVTIEFGNEISRELNERALDLAHYFDINPFPGLIEIVPAYASVTVFYDPLTVRTNFPSAPTTFAAVRNLIETARQNHSASIESEPQTIDIPVSFAKESAMDLSFVASFHGLSEREVIEIFLSRIYRVFMLGFLPGFAYLGEVSEKIATPRKETPRLAVPKGSVGIAGRQTGIYPLVSPGGWQIIGRTETEMFTTGNQEPCLLKPGDLVRFYAF